MLEMGLGEEVVVAGVDGVDVGSPTLGTHGHGTRKGLAVLERANNSGVYTKTSIVLGL